MEVDELIRRATADLEEAEAQLRAAEGRVMELRTIRDGLRFAVQRYGNMPVLGTAPTTSESSADSARLRDGETEISQTDRVFNTLEGIGRPAKSHEVHAKVQAAGYDYSFEQVRSALGYLLRKKRIKRVGKALWEVPAAWPSPPSFAPAVETAGAGQAGEGYAARQVDAFTGAGLNSHPANQASF
jgi:hypothetical protein